MNTPIFDFVTAYIERPPVRLHMPGHKGAARRLSEDRDITEIPGADALYEAGGIIAESEANASALFGCPTFYAVEGSSQCIRAMLYLAMRHAQNAGTQPKILAARNAHKTFLSAAALLDLDVAWLFDAAPSYLSASLDPAAIAAAIEREQPTALYLTVPDYLGDLPDLSLIARVCRDSGVLLLVDNAHGAYLRFLTPSRHPIDLGADLCCDSAHKTLSALTGSAYLHLSPALGALSAEAKDALLLFGSTSPSYLILQSLDLLNPMLETLPEKLSAFVPKLDALKTRLAAAGWTLYGNEPLKLTLCPKPMGYTATALARLLEADGIFCEFADPDFLVCMFTPENGEADLVLFEQALGAIPRLSPIEARPPRPAIPERVCPIRKAMLGPRVVLPYADCLGRVLARPDVGCPPAVPILMPGERIGEAALEAFRCYGVDRVSVIPE